MNLTPMLIDDSLALTPRSAANLERSGKFVRQQSFVSTSTAGRKTMGFYVHSASPIDSALEFYL